jgi:dipeptidyl-peptidase 4
MKTRLIEKRERLSVSVLTVLFLVQTLLAQALFAAGGDGAKEGGREKERIPVRQANFELAGRWTVEKQLDRIEGLWTVPLWFPGEDRFVCKRKSAGKGGHLLVDPAAGRAEPFSDGAKIAELEKSLQAPSPGSHLLSPDGKYQAYTHGHDLYLAGTDGKGETIRVTSDGVKDLRFSLDGRWSPDSRYLAFLREDWRKVRDLWLVDPVADPRPTLETYKWPVPGEDVEQYSLWVFDCRKKKTVPVRADLRSVKADLRSVRADRWVDQTLARIQWSPDSKSVYFTRMSRDWKSLDLCAADPATGECRAIVEERGHRQIITRPPCDILQKTGEILWWSMRAGWGHFYLFDRSGALKARVTEGAFHSGTVVRIDEEERVLYFMGNGREAGRNPYFHHLYRVNLDGTGLTLLTPEDGEHEVSFSPTGRVFLDNFSRSDLAPRAVVRDCSGKQVMELEAADISALEKAGWMPPEIFRAKAADGTTDLWGVLFKPFDFDPRKKYPIISYGYPGKEGEAIPWKFYNNSWVTLTSVSLAQYGFIVAVYGNRGGSPERSCDYYDFGWDDLRDYPIADKKTVIHQLAARHDCIDIDRVGIVGASSGGFMAATAILTEPDFFKVAVSRAGNHDNNLYWHHWNERYGAVTQEADDAGRTRFLSRSATNNEIAANLKGRLLLVQGDMDRHVPPSQTLRLADALIEAGKRFDMFIVPGCDHFFGKNWQYVIRTMELYFVENLIGDNRWSADILGDVE